VLDPFTCYLRVMMLKGDERQAAADVRLMLTRVGWMDFDVLRTAHSIKIRYNIFAKPRSAIAALVNSLACFLSYYPLIGQFCGDAYLNSEDYHHPSLRHYHA